ncbi:hypothetical protein [Roseinatronobacter sp.]
MRYFAYILIVILTFSGLSQARVSAFSEFQSGNSQPQTLAVLCSEFIGRDGDDLQPAPSGSDDPATCPTRHGNGAIPDMAQLLCARATAAPHARSMARCPPARAPPAQMA